MLDFGGVFEEVHVTKHHDTGEEKCCGVGLTMNVTIEKLASVFLFTKEARFCLKGFGN